MKAVFGWLGDPYLHLVGIGLVVLTLGSRMGGDPSRGESSSNPCVVCSRYHDDAKACIKVAANRIEGR